ncbi:hypothetical protein JCM10213v2_003678 [Rhodosporidiobolus nylandii]
MPADAMAAAAGSPAQQLDSEVPDNGESPSRASAGSQDCGTDAGKDAMQGRSETGGEDLELISLPSEAYGCF